MSDQLDGTPDNHSVFRTEAVQYIEANSDDFAPFIEDDIPFERVQTLEIV